PSSLQTVSIPAPGNGAWSSWEMPATCILEEVEFLKNGHYGAICKGQLKREGVATAVLVKTLKGNPNSQEAKVFVELALFHAAICKHDNVVQMLYCQMHRFPMYLIFEAVVPGNLLHFLWSLREGAGGLSCHQLQCFSERSVYLVAKQVASGLDYLLTDHRLVHGNVAARSMLIGPGLSVKVSGLAMAFEARRTGTLQKEEAAKVPVKWQAPEQLMRLPITSRSDVWSFGILLYELITLGDPPFPELDPSEVCPKTLANYKIKRPQNCGGALYDLMKYCCMWNFKDRPVYPAIIRLLESCIHLADMKTLSAAQTIDICEYRRKAGLPT
ncbi:hypothetical protein NFI96_032883, partial [Prochilodus magdalenae]